MIEKLEQGKIIPIKYDRMFSEIFNNENNINILEEFIADYFNYNLEEVRGNVEIDSRTLKKREFDDNKREVDLLFKYKGELRNIEISTGWDEGIINRNVIYLTDIHSSQVYENYKDIKQTIQINLLAFTPSKLREIKTELYLCDPKTGYIVTSKLRMDIINMEKGKSMCYNGEEERDKLIRWCKIFTSENKEEFEKTVNETLTYNSRKRLLSEVIRLSGEKEMIEGYKEKTKQEMEHESIMQSLKEEKEKLDNEKEKLDDEKEKLDNEKEKLVKEKERLNQEFNNFNNKIKIEKIEIAKNMINKNMDLDLISEITGLTIDEIKTL